uniref:Uncharacterized protein n=1 Tax=Lepeophtheirus salmonis TaxID=72036 RepID=A0A0K2U4S8_LEPSM
MERGWRIGQKLWNIHLVMMREKEGWPKWGRWKGHEWRSYCWRGCTAASIRVAGGG